MKNGRNNFSRSLSQAGKSRVRRNAAARDLEVNEDLQFQQREWRAERIGWGAMAALILAALVGLFGDGIFSKTSAGDRNGDFWLEYERFGRYKKAMSLKAHLQPTTSFSATTLGFDRRYLENFRIERMLPPPQKVEIDGDSLRYFFQVTSADQPVVVEMLLEPLQSGVLALRIKNDQAQSLEIRHFIYP